MQATTTRGVPTLKSLLREAETFVEEVIVGRRGGRLGFITWSELVELARSRGVILVMKKPLSVPGQTVDLGEKRGILINENDSSAQQRYTLAREISLTFVEERVDALAEASKAAIRALDQFCETLASRIVMPRPMLMAELKGKVLEPSMLVDLADRYDVSVQALSIRVLELYNKPCSISEWEAAPGAGEAAKLRRTWITSSSRLRRLVPSSVAPGTPIEHLFLDIEHSGRATFDGEMPTRKESLSIHALAELMQQRNDSTIMLVVIHPQ